jgi:hypothetical protein
MTSIIHDFKSIRQKLERQEQKAEYEAKEAEQRASYAGQCAAWEQLSDSAKNEKLREFYDKLYNSI